MANSREKEFKINQHLDNLDNWLEDGPPDETVSSEQFLRDLANESRLLTGAIEALIPSDVDEIWPEDENEVED